MPKIIKSLLAGNYQHLAVKYSDKENYVICNNDLVICLEDHYLPITKWDERLIVLYHKLHVGRGTRIAIMTPVPEEMIGDVFNALSAQNYIKYNTVNRVHQFLQGNQNMRGTMHIPYEVKAAVHNYFDDRGQVGTYYDSHVTGVVDNIWYQFAHVKLDYANEMPHGMGLLDYRLMRQQASALEYQVDDCQKFEQDMLLPVIDALILSDDPINYAGTYRDTERYHLPFVHF